MCESLKFFFYIVLFNGEFIFSMFTMRFFFISAHIEEYMIIFDCCQSFKEKSLCSVSIAGFGEVVYLKIDSIIH